MLHSFGAFSLHSDGGVGIGAEGEGGGGVPQIFLYGFDIIASFQAIDGICMAKIMKTHRAKADFFHDLFIIAVNCLIGDESPIFIGEHQIIIVTMWL